MFKMRIKCQLRGRGAHSPEGSAKPFRPGLDTDNHNPRHAVCTLLPDYGASAPRRDARAHAATDRAPHAPLTRESAAVEPQGSNKDRTLPPCHPSRGLQARVRHPSEPQKHMNSARANSAERKPLQRANAGGGTDVKLASEP